MAGPGPFQGMARGMGAGRSRRACLADPMALVVQVDPAGRVDRVDQAAVAVVPAAVVDAVARAEGLEVVLAAARVPENGTTFPSASRYSTSLITLTCRHRMEL